MASGYYLKEIFPKSKLGVAEALQCPTILNNGFGDHRIEGIGDKHIPWVHDAKNTDMVVAIDDEVAIRMLRLFNEKKGIEALKANGVSSELAENLNLLGISGIGNLISAIKMAKYYELTEKDYLVTVFTDSMELYGSRIKELEEERGKYTDKNVERDLQLVESIGTDSMQELSYQDRKRIHNLKYYTWIEQQGRELKELNAQWFDHENYWLPMMKQADEIDNLINDFNHQTGLL